MILAITGHRPSKLGNEYDLIGPFTDFIKTRLYEIIDSEKPTKIISGMALGVDQIWAICGIRKNIPVIAAIPFVGQELNWPPKSQSLYKRILRSTSVESKIICNGKYSPRKMQIRNMWMVDNCNKLIAVWDGTSGGTANCVEYAKTVGREIIMVNPKDVNG